jgi:hypothetical protein
VLVHPQLSGLVHYWKPLVAQLRAVFVGVHVDLIGSFR